MSPVGTIRRIIVDPVVRARRVCAHRHPFHRRRRSGPGLCGGCWDRDAWLTRHRRSTRPGSPGVGRVTLRLPVRSQSDFDGLASHLAHAQMLSGGDPERVSLRPSHPTPVQPVVRRGRHRERIAPYMKERGRSTDPARSCLFLRAKASSCSRARPAKRSSRGQRWRSHRRLGVDAGEERRILFRGRRLCEAVSSHHGVGD